MPTTIRVEVPFHLQNLAKCPREIDLELNGETTIGGVLDALEARYPVIRGAIRDHVTHKRRPFVRFYACQEDLSQLPYETPLPEAVLNRKEPFLIIGSMAGG